MCICSSSAKVRAQVLTAYNVALSRHSVDAASLGAPGRAFLEYTLGGGFGWTASAGLGIGGGASRASFGKNYPVQSLGLGFARLIATRPAGQSATIGAGFDLSGAFDVSRSTAMSARGVQLAIPGSIRWDSLSGWSFAPYVGPFAELGSTPRLQYSLCPEICIAPPFGLMRTRAAGLVTGFELSRRRVAVETGVRDMLLNMNSTIATS
jgi:hypothetical protein